MTPERWQKIRDVLEKALELGTGERSAFLDGACSSDPCLRQEVETLLSSSHDVRSSFLQSPPLSDGLGADPDWIDAAFKLELCPGGLAPTLDSSSSKKKAPKFYRGLFQHVVRAFHSGSRKRQFRN